MLTERDIKNALEVGTTNEGAPDWVRWGTPPFPQAKAWSSEDGDWLIQYLPNPDAPRLAVGNTAGEQHVHTYLEVSDDRLAVRILRLASVAPEDAMQVLHEDVDSAKTVAAVPR